MYRYCLIHCFSGLKKPLQGVGKFPTLALDVTSLMSRLGPGFKGIKNPKILLIRIKDFSASIVVNKKIVLTSVLMITIKIVDVVFLS